MAQEKDEKPEAEDAADKAEDSRIEEAETPEPEEASGEDAIEEAEIVEDAGPDELDEAGAEEAEPEPEATADPVPAPAPEPVVIRKGGFLPMLLGGVAAAAIGVGAARYVLPESWLTDGNDAFEASVTERFDAQAGALETLKGDLPDIAPLEARISELQASLEGISSELAAAGSRMGEMETRLTDLEKRPITGAADSAAVAAYERELAALREAMTSQREEIESLVASATEKEASAEITAQQAMKRAALSRIQTALDAGTGFADAAASLSETGVSLPPALSQTAEAGVATSADLAEGFPDAARAALAVARKGESGGGFGSFLKDQLGVRSLEPREGSDADAVLSRAEAAVKQGRIGDALAEIETLPEEARAEMSDWLAQAHARLDALAAAEALVSELN